MASFLAHAVASLLGKPGDLGIPDQNAGDAELMAFINVIYLIAGGIAVIVLIIAGINYITSAGSAEKITKAKNTIVYTVVGIILITGAFVITNFVMSR